MEEFQLGVDFKFSVSDIYPRHPSCDSIAINLRQKINEAIQNEMIHAIVNSL